MAEEALVAELRAGYAKFEADLRRAKRAADRQSSAIATSLKNVEKAASGLPGEFSKLSSELSATSRHSASVASSMNKVSASLAFIKRAALGVSTAIATLGFSELVGGGIRASQSLESVEAQLRNLSGSAAQAKEEMKFIEEVTTRLGQSTLEGAKGFALIANAAKGTKIEGEGVRQTFLALNEVAVANNLTNEQYASILNQVTQIISKQKLTQEELSQIAENGISATRLFAQALGTTGEKLAEGISKGQVPYESLLLLIQEIRKENSVLADEAAQKIPVGFKRAFIQAKKSFSDFIGAVLESKELKSFFEDFFGGANTSSFFPSGEDVTKSVDRIVRVVRGYFAILATIGEGTKKAILVALDFVSNAFERVLNGVRQAYATTVQTLRRGLEKISFGTLFKGASEEVDAEVKKIEISLSDVLGDALSNLSPIQKGISLIISADPEALKKADEYLKRVFGIEDKPLLNPKKVEDASKKSANALSSSYEKKLDDIKKRSQKALSFSGVSQDLEKEIKSIERSISSSIKKVEEISRTAQRHAKEASQEAARFGDQDALEASDRAYRNAVEAQSLVTQTKAEAEKVLALTAKASSAVSQANEQAARSALDSAKEAKTQIDDLLILSREAGRETSKAAKDAIKANEEVIERFIEDFERPFINAKEDILDLFNDILVDVFEGQVPRIKDVADSIRLIFAQMAADIITDFARAQIQESFDNMLKSLSESASKQQGSGGSGGGSDSGSGFLSSIFDVFSFFGGSGGGASGASGTQLAYAAPQGSSGVAGTQGAAGAGAGGGASAGSIGGGLLAGIGLGSGVNNFAGGGTTGRYAGSIIGGAGGGAIIGSSYGPYGALIGAAAGAVVGAISAAIIGALGKKKKSEFGLQTTAGTPSVSDLEDEIFKRGPFGVISLADSKSKRVSAGLVTDIIQQIDFSIAGLINDRQEEIVSQALQSQGVKTYKDKDLDDAVNQAIFERYFTVIQSLGGTKAATRIVGPKGSDAPEDLYEVQQRVESALSLFRLIEEFKQGPITDTARAIKNINEEFEALVAKAEQLGLPEKDIVAIREEEQRRIAEITKSINEETALAILRLTDPIAAEWEELERIQKERLENARDAGADLVEIEKRNALERQKLAEEVARISSDFNKDIAIEILKFTDPVKAEWENLARIQEERLRRAREAGANIVEVERLNALEREALAKKLAKESEKSTTKLSSDLESFLKGSLPNIKNQLNELYLSYVSLVEEAKRLGIKDRLDDSYRSQKEEIRRSARETFTLSRDQLISPFQAAMSQLNNQVRGFQDLVDGFIVHQAEINRFSSLARENIRYQEAIRLAGGQSVKAKDQFVELIDAFDNSTRAVSDYTQHQEALKDQYENLVDAFNFLGHSTTGLTNVYLRNVSRLREEATRSYQSQFDQLRAPLRSQPIQEIESLRASYITLRDSASELGIGLTELRNTFDDVQNLIKNSARREIYIDYFATIGDSFEVAKLNLERDLEELGKFLEGNIIYPQYEKELRELKSGSIFIEEALNRIGGGSQSSITQVADAFESFISAGNPLSQASQELYNVTETFLALVDASKLLGLSTSDLEKSYVEQATKIREQAIENIDQTLEPRRQGVESIKDYLDSLKIGTELPSNLRFDEVRTQFLDAVAGGNIQSSLSLAEEFRQIARERFGGTAGFFTARNEIQDALSALQTKETAAIEAERQRLIRQENNQLQQIELTRNSVDYLQRITASSTDTSRGIDQLISIARSQQQIDAATQSLLRRLLDEIGA